MNAKQQRLTALEKINFDLEKTLEENNHELQVLRQQQRKYREESASQVESAQDLQSKLFDKEQELKHAVARLDKKVRSAENEV